MLRYFAYLQMIQQLNIKRKPQKKRHTLTEITRPYHMLEQLLSTIWIRDKHGRPTCEDTCKAYSQNFVAQDAVRGCSNGGSTRGASVQRLKWTWSSPSTLHA